jgi:hypothetical protein
LQKKSFAKPQLWNIPIVKPLSEKIAPVCQHREVSKTGYPDRSFLHTGGCQLKKYYAAQPKDRPTQGVNQSTIY